MIEAYHWLRSWSAPEHQTMWVEIQAVATIAAFAAAYWYASIARRQTAAVVSQKNLAEKDYIERNKPVVYLDRVEDAANAQQNVRYVAHNVGGGFAVNVYVFDVTLLQPVSAGSLAAGEERTLPERLNQRICDNGAGSKHMVIAEGPFSRTTQWTATFNVRTQTAGEHRGQVVHHVAEVAVAPPRFEFQSLSDYLESNINGFRAQMRKLEQN